MAIDWLEKLVSRFYEVTSKRKGEYMAIIEVQDVLYKLLKCELGTVHTYLLLDPFDVAQARALGLSRIIVDSSVSQFYFIPDLLESRDYEKAADMGLEVDAAMWFVGDGEEAFRVRNALCYWVGLVQEGEAMLHLACICLLRRYCMMNAGSMGLLCSFQFWIVEIRFVIAVDA